MKFLRGRYGYLVLLLVIILLGAFLRFYKLGEESFVADEFLGVNTAYGFLHSGEWKRWDFNHGGLFNDEAYYKTFFDLDFWGGGETSYTRAWIYNWQIAQSLKFFPDDDEYAYRFASACWGVISIILVFIISLKLTRNKVIGTLSAFLMAISLDGIDFGRKVRMYSMFMPIFLVFSYYVFCFLEDKKRWGLSWLDKFNKKVGFNMVYLIPVVLLGVLSMHLHLLTVNIIPIVLIYICACFVVEYQKTKSYKNKYGAYLSLVLLICTIGYSKLGVMGNFLGWENHYSYVEKILADYPSKILAVSLILFGTYQISKKGNRSGLFVSAAFWTIILMAIFFWKRSPGEQYIYFIKPFQLILISSGIYGLFLFMKDNLKRSGEKIAITTVCLVLLILPDYLYFFQNTNFYNQTMNSESPDYKQAFSYFLRHKKDGDILITREFRNFYFRGANAEVVSLGGERSSENERRITENRLDKLVKNSNACVWVIISDNDRIFITKEAEKYLESKMYEVESNKVRGSISAYTSCTEE